MRTMHSITVVVLAPIASVVLIACGSEQKEAQSPTTVTVAKPTAEPMATAESTSAPVAAKPPAKPSMAEMQKKNIASVQGAFNAHDAKRLASYYSGDCSLRSPGRDGWKEEKGRDAMEKSHGELFQRFPDLKVVTTRVLLKGDVASWEWSTNGTDTVGMKDEKPTGKPFGFNAVSVMWFDDDGLVKQEWTYFDAATIASQLGKAPKEMKSRPIPTLPGGDAMWVEAKGDGKEAKNLDTTKAFYATFEKKDEKGFLALLDDNVVHSDQTSPVDFTGKDTAKKGFDAYRKAFPDSKLTPDYQWPVADYVVVVATMTGTNKGALPPMVPRATGKQVNYHFVDVVELRDGKIVRATSYGNGNEIAVQLGLLPKSKEPMKEKAAPPTEPSKDKAAAAPKKAK